MKSALDSRLAPDDKLKLRDYVVTRLTELRSQRDQRFDIILRRIEAMMAGNFSYRKQLEGAPEEKLTIFDKSNESAFLIRSVWRFVTARLCKDLFGGKDWFKASPPEQEGQDGGMAEKLQNHAECKLREADWVAKAREIVGTALAMGFCCVKTAWDEQVDFSEDIQTLLTDAAGNALAGADGSFFTPDDELQEVDGGGGGQQDPEAMAAGMLQSVQGGGQEQDTNASNQPGEVANSGGEQQPAPDEQEAAGDPDAAMEGAEQIPPPEPAQPAPLTVFAKDPEQEGPGGPSGHTFQEKVVPKMNRLFARLNASPVHWKDVAYPVNAASMNLDDPDCDMIAFTTPRSVDDLRMQFDPDGTNTQVQDVLAKVGQKAQTTPQSEGAKAKEEFGEVDATRSDPDNPGVKVTEVYFRRRLPGAPGPSRICMVLIEDTGAQGEVLWQDYLSAFSPKSQAPLHMVSVNKVPGRAYGMGMYETYEIPGNIVDAMINGVIVRNNEHCNPIKLVQRGALKGTQDGNPALIGPNRWLEVELKGIPIGQVLQHLELPDLDERTWQLLEMFMQLMQTESGVTNAAQGDLSNLPSNGTATGVNSLLESSSVLHNFSLEEFRTGLRAPLAYAIALLYFQQDGDETYTDNQGAMGGVMTLADAQALKAMALHVEITLTRAKKEEEKQAAMAAIPLAIGFYNLPPGVQIHLLDGHIMALRANGIENAETWFPTKDEIMQTIQAQQMQPPLPPGGGEAQPGQANEQQAPDNVTEAAFAA